MSFPGPGSTIVSVCFPFKLNTETHQSLYHRRAPRACQRGWFWSRLTGGLNGSNQFLSFLYRRISGERSETAIRWARQQGRKNDVEFVHVRYLLNCLCSPGSAVSACFQKRHIGGGCHVNILLSCVCKPRPEQREYCLSARVRSAFTANTLLPERT